MSFSNPFHKMEKLRITTVCCLAICLFSIVWVGSVQAQTSPRVVVVPLGAEDPDLNRTLLFDANGLGSGPTNNSEGLVFSNTFNGLTCCTNLVIKRPRDWDGESDVRVDLFTRGSTTGTDSFFVRPRDYNDGDTFLDTAAISTNTVNYTSSLQFRELSVTFSAASLPKDWWYFVIQRATSSGTNTGNITLLSIAVSYTAAR